MIGNNFKVRFCLCLSPASQFDSTFVWLPSSATFWAPEPEAGVAQAEVAQEEGKGEPSGSRSRLTHEAQLIGNLLFGEKINSIHPHKIWIHIATNDFLIKSSAINLVLNMTVCEKMQLQVPGSSAARQRLIEVGGISQQQLSAVQFDWYQFRAFTPRTTLPLKATNSTHQQRH